jgi:hypothetical protein
MPRYLLETPPAGRDEPGAALALAARQFPELAVEHVLSAGGREDQPARSLWVCRAPSSTHVRRWADAAHLRVRALTAVGSDHRP